MNQHTVMMPVKLKNKHEPLYRDDARPIYFWIGQLSLELFPLIFLKKNT